MTQDGQSNRMVNLFCDGACHTNTGNGGYGVVIVDYDTGEQQEISGGEKKTTNNRMEITSVIKGLEFLGTEKCEVMLVSDSKYVINAIDRWLSAWEAQGWRKNDGSKVLNVDLWKKLIPLLNRHNVTPVWVEGHTGEYPEHTRADELAVAGSNSLD